MNTMNFRQIHLDFHTSEKIEDICSKFDAIEFAKTMKEANVNSVTCFAKCHHGNLYYDSDLPNKHPFMKINLLSEQINALHNEGIKAPIYITVGFDEYAAREHPEWVMRNENGRNYGAKPLEPGWHNMCLNSPYKDTIMAECIEILEKFKGHIDGLFFDIVFQYPCCCKFCIDDMLKENIDIFNTEEKIKFAKRVENKFKKDIFTLIREYDKSCTIYFNNGRCGEEILDTLQYYSHLEVEALASGGWGYDYFPLTAKYARNLGKEILAMTGNFHKGWADFGGYKNKSALEFDCFMALAHGAKCSIGDQMHPTGKLNQFSYKTIGSVFKSVMDKEEYCNNTTQVVDIGVIPPKFNHWNDLPSPSHKGVFRILEEAHFQYDIITPEMDLSKYKMIILADEVFLNDNNSKRLKDYLCNGGKLISTYMGGLNKETNKFVDEFGILGFSNDQIYPNYITPSEELCEGLEKTPYVLYEKGLTITKTNDVKIIASLKEPYFKRDFTHFCSHEQTPPAKDSIYPGAIMKNNIIYFPSPLFSMYSKHGYLTYKKLIVNAINLLLNDPCIELTAPSTAKAYLNRQEEEKRLILHILHYIPEKRCDAIEIVEDVIPLYDISVLINTKNKIEKIYLVPENIDIPYKEQNGNVKFVVPKINGHQMVVLNYSN